MFHYRYRKEFCALSVRVSEELESLILQRPETFYHLQVFLCRYVIGFLLLGAMSINGVANINHSLDIKGEFNSPHQEELFLWINKRTKPTAVFAGPMPLTANLRLPLL